MPRVFSRGPGSTDCTRGRHARSRRLLLLGAAAIALAEAGCGSAGTDPALGTLQIVLQAAQGQPDPFADPASKEVHVRIAVANTAVPALFDQWFAIGTGMEIDHLTLGTGRNLTVEVGDDLKVPHYRGAANDLTFSRGENLTITVLLSPIP